MTASALMTAKDLEQLPRDGRRYDLIKGVLKPMPPTGGPHQVVMGRLISYLNQYLEPRNLGTAGGEGGFVFADDPDTVLGPDVSVILAEQFPSIQTPGYMRIVPPLVAEVRSPSNRSAEIEEKVRIYLRAGVQLVLVIDTGRRTVRVRTPDGDDVLLTEADDLTGGTLFPGFRVPIARLFRWLI